jgi:hypothetical protein
VLAKRVLVLVQENVLVFMIRAQQTPKMMPTETTFVVTSIHARMTHRMMQIAMEAVQINRLARMTLRTTRIATMFVVMWTRVLTIMTMIATVTPSVATKILAR